MTGTDVVSLLEGDYEQGLGALVNSLVRTGFTGTVWAGHRGPAPGWAALHREPAPGVEVVFVPVRTERHLTNHKPRFLAEVFDRSDAERLAYRREHDLVAEVGGEVDPGAADRIGGGNTWPWHGRTAGPAWSWVGATPASGRPGGRRRSCSRTRTRSTWP